MRLILGDCLEKLKEIPDNSVDLVVADPPYGVLNKGKAFWDKIIPFEPLWEQLERVGKENTAKLIFCQEPFTSFLVMSNLKDFKYKLYWQKTHPTGFLNSKKQPLRCVEEISVFYKKQPKYNIVKSEGHPPAHDTVRRADVVSGSGCYGKVSKDAPYKGGNTDRFPTNLMKFALDLQKSYLHPTQKPVALLEHLIRLYSDENDVILDFCMGSGSTGVACRNLKRHFIGIEKDEKYFEIAKARLSL